MMLDMMLYIQRILKAYVQAYRQPITKNSFSLQIHAMMQYSFIRCNWLSIPIYGNHIQSSFTLHVNDVNACIQCKNTMD